MQRSVTIVGWSTIIVSILTIFLELTNLLGSSLTDQMNLLIGSFPQARAALDSMNNMILYSQIWSFYMIFYFLNVLGGAVQFVRYKEIGRKILEITCWVGLLNASMDTFLSYMLLKNMQTALSTTLRTMGGGLGSLSLIGMATIVIGFFIWIIPSIGMIVYLKSQRLKVLMR